MTDTIRTTYNLDELAALCGLPQRTVRYYIQKGMVARPVGQTRNAVYDARHLEALLRIKRWTDAGLSLARIAELLLQPELPKALPTPAPGTVEVRTHVLLAEGLELVIAPEQARLNPEQLRGLIRSLLDTVAAHRAATSTAVPAGAASEPEN